MHRTIVCQAFSFAAAIVAFPSSPLSFSSYLGFVLRASLEVGVLDESPSPCRDRVFSILDAACFSFVVDVTHRLPFFFFTWNFSSVLEATGVRLP